MSHILSVTVDTNSIASRIPEIEEEKEQALKDLIGNNLFSPYGKQYGKGPYNLHLSITHNRKLCLHLTNADSHEDSGKVMLPLSSFRKIVRDYFQICESYFAAIKTHSPSKIETIDMARRSVHNEGAQLLYDLLCDQEIELNHDTARQLFTLICVLHIRQETGR